tara:strand:- start:1347 stop:2075 length:729 start_codon:yes stop_codon:yes gene_type:complete
MKALLLAAGLGSRLKPITNTIPKCLVPIDEKPLLEFWLDILSVVGVDDFYINVHFHADAVRDFIKKSAHADNITIIEEDTLLGTGGTLKKNAPMFFDDTFILAHADNLCLTDFKAFINAHETRPPNVALTMMTFDPPDPKSCGVVSLDGQNVVTSFHEKVENPPTRLANGAVFIMEPEVALFSQNVDADHFEISLDIIPNYINRILAWHNHDYHLDIGTPETYAKAQDDIEILRALYKKFTV